MGYAPADFERTYFQVGFYKPGEPSKPSWVTSTPIRPLGPRACLNLSHLPPRTSSLETGGKEMQAQGLSRLLRQQKKTDSQLGGVYGNSPSPSNRTAHSADPKIKGRAVPFVAQERLSYPAGEIRIHEQATAQQFSAHLDAQCAQTRAQHTHQPEHPSSQRNPQIRVQGSRRQDRPKLVDPREVLHRRGPVHPALCKSQQEPERIEQPASLPSHNHADISPQQQVRSESKSAQSIRVPEEQFLQKQPTTLVRRREIIRKPLSVINKKRTIKTIRRETSTGYGGILDVYYIDEDVSDPDHRNFEDASTSDDDSDLSLSQSSEHSSLSMQASIEEYYYGGGTAAWHAKTLQGVEEEFPRALARDSDTNLVLHSSQGAMILTSRYSEL